MTRDRTEPLSPRTRETVRQFYLRARLTKQEARLLNYRKLRETNNLSLVLPIRGRAVIDGSPHAPKIWIAAPKVFSPNFVVCSEERHDVLEVDPNMLMIDLAPTLNEWRYAGPRRRGGSRIDG